MGHRALLVKLVQDVRASYWFLPLVLAFGAILLAQVTLYIDHHAAILPFGLPDSWQSTQVDGARATLAVISQSIMGVAGVMFSMTIVAVSFASGNFGPRLIGNFMRDRGNQWSLGILIATFVYTLLVLRAVQSKFGAEGPSAIAAFVPHYSLLVALALTLMSIMTIIYLLHHIPETINVSNITAGLGTRMIRDLRSRIDQQHEEAEEKAGSDPADDDTAAGDFPKGRPDHHVTLDDSGYIQTWNKDRLDRLARENDLYIEVLAQTGDFVSPFAPVLSIWNISELSEDLRADLCECFAIGYSPTETQNMGFILDQLVEMTARALSPGVNDPYTAINCINWIYTGLSTAANYRGGLVVKPERRIKMDPLSFQLLLDAGIEQALPYTNSDPLASRHMAMMLRRLHEETSRADLCRAISRMMKKASKAQED